ncbi:MAG: 1-acyl-sn-glycerol-3-phosphate acyltransferase [Promethearchaeota archaeon]|nr:MAG: 1-acyl-sn-glycerol-3-phosphate acyltransferase [Candidatus Lokiarchaeota archaeon]
MSVNPNEHPQETKEFPKNDSLVKLLLKNNPFDPFCDWARKKMRNLGVLEVFDEFIYWNVGRANFIQVFRTFWGYEIEGKENFPEYGGALVIANHQSELDPFLVGSAVHRKVQWLSKAENFNIPIFRSVIKPFGTIPLKRGQKDEEALMKVRAVLEGGGCVGMFPEGTRSTDGKLGEFRSGGAFLCLDTRVPYVPCAIFGAYKVFPKNVDATGIKWRQGLKISIRIGKPVYIDPDLESNFENAQIVKQAMENDIILLRAGKTNQSRVIRSKKDIAPLVDNPNLQELIQETRIPPKDGLDSKNISDTDEIDNLSIS